MKAYLGLGANLGDRRACLEQALGRLQELSRRPLRVSPVYETPALLPAGAQPEWNRPFFNLVVELETDLDPQNLLNAAKDIERALGRQSRALWAPREIDIDLLFCGELSLRTKTLVLPHPRLEQRAFVLDPLKDLAPSLSIAGKTAMERARALPEHAPLWMAILNLTPDSFSDGGDFLPSEKWEAYLEEMDAAGVGALDLGAESTRPGARTLEEDEEWERLAPLLEHLQLRYRGRRIRPLLSLDTRKFATARRALEYGVDILNDVSGLADERFLDLLRGADCQYVLMHSLTVPADPQVTLASGLDVVEEIKEWFSRRLETLLAAGVRQDQVILDPGIGFGKNRLQSLQLVRGIAAFFPLGCRVLAGHSRKSFLQDFAPAAAKERELESIGVSLALAQKGVDILRVHQPTAHLRAYRGFVHAKGNA